MAQSEWNHSLPHDTVPRDTGAATRNRNRNGGNGRAKTERSNTGLTQDEERIGIHTGSADGGETSGITDRLQQMYREVVDEPLPAPFRSLIRRLRGAGPNGTGSDGSSGS